MNRTQYFLSEANNLVKEMTVEGSRGFDELGNEQLTFIPENSARKGHWWGLG